MRSDGEPPFKGQRKVIFMRRVLLATRATAAIGVAGMAAPASAQAVLVDQGITYQLDLNSITGNTGYFTLNISGINTASDTEGGRTGINAFAFNDPATGNATSGTSTGFTFHTGGLNSGGCNGNGNFYCFGNSGYVLPALGSGGSMSLNFNVTSNTAGSWDPANWVT